MFWIWVSASFVLGVLVGGAVVWQYMRDEIDDLINDQDRIND